MLGNPTTSQFAIEAPRKDNGSTYSLNESALEAFDADAAKRITSPAMPIDGWARERRAGVADSAPAEVRKAKLGY
jgi:hypothetical protein